MQNNSETNRPPIPMWGSEITIPLESEDLVNGGSYSFSIDNADEPSVSSPSSDPSTYLTPTEEYLQLTKRLIESKSLPSRTRKKLKTLYATYESVDGYVGTTFDSAKKNDRKRSTAKSHKSKESDKTKEHHVHSKKDTTADGQISLPDQEETRSVSPDEDQSEISSIQTQMTEQFDQEEIRVGSDAFTDYFTTPWYGLQDFMFGRPCDPDLIKIDDVFSDFTLRDASYDQQMKREIRKWIEDRSLLRSASSGICRVVRELYAELEMIITKDDEGRRSKSNRSPE